jgi:hypothetical protein
MLNKAQIDALEQLREKATPGLWGDNGGIYTLTDAGKGYPLDFYTDSVAIADDGDADRCFLSQPNRDLIIAAVNALPSLIAHAREGGALE